MDEATIVGLRERVHPGLPPIRSFGQKINFHPWMLNQAIFPSFKNSKRIRGNYAPTCRFDIHQVVLPVPVDQDQIRIDPGPIRDFVD
jgi:hypothetical protein